MIRSLSRPGETRGRALICAAAVVALVVILASGCETTSQAVERCRTWCAPFAVQSFEWAPNGRNSRLCLCADRLADGGRP